VGYNLFSFFDKAIILDQQLRQCDDEKFAKIVQNVRYGRGDDENYDNIEKRMLPDYTDSGIKTTPPDLNFFDPTRQMSKIITSTNSTRRDLNELLVENFARMHNQPVFKIYCADTFKLENSKTVPSESLIRRVRDIPDEKTENIAGVLTVTCGIPLMILKNTSVPLGVTNGSHGTLDRIIFNNDDHTKYDFSKFGIYHVKEMPELLLIKFDANTLKFKETEHLGQDLFPLPPTTGTFHLRYTKAKDSFSIKVTRRGFAVTPGFCITIHKSQGETMDNGIVDLVPACKNYDAALSYVALSRYRSLQNIHLLRKFDRDVISKAPRLGLREFYGKAKQMENHLIQQLECNRLYRD
jgi:ATP-dependent exoDNAse (exonuclease V) alpha subunit